MYCTKQSNKVHTLRQAAYLLYCIDSLNKVSFPVWEYIPLHINYVHTFIRTGNGCLLIKGVQTTTQKLAL
jgi:hypothetical protein